jgi:hypothetical protein
MLKAILDALYYCCYREKPEIRKEAVVEDFVEQLEALAEHEVKFIINKVIKNRNMLKSCC